MPRAIEAFEETPSGRTSTRWVLRVLEQGRAAKLAAFLSAILTIPAIGYLDYIVGHEATVATFYLAPVVLVAWVFGRGAGIVAAIACALVGLLTHWALPDFGSGQVYAFNAAARGIQLVAAAILTSATHAALRERSALARRLEQALSEVRTLEGLLPICAWCKRIREGEEDGAVEWQAIEHYVATHSDATFTHGICPDCTRRLVAEGRGQFSAD